MASAPSVTLLYTPRPLYRPRGGSGIDYYELAFAREPVPPNAVDVILDWFAQTLPPPPAVLTQRGLLSSQAWEAFSGAYKASIAAARSKAFSWGRYASAFGGCILVAGIVLMVVADRKARAVWEAQSHSDDDSFYPDYTIPLLFPDLWFAGIGCVVIGSVGAVTGWLVGCCRAAAVMGQATGAAVDKGNVALEAATGGQVRATFMQERLTCYLQAEGSSPEVTATPRPVNVLRLTAAPSDPADPCDPVEPLHPPMTLETHGYLPGMPGFVLGGDGKPVRLPPLPPGCVLVNPVDFMSPAHGQIIVNLNNA